MNLTTTIRGQFNKSVCISVETPAQPVRLAIQRPEQSFPGLPPSNYTETEVMDFAAPFAIGPPSAANFKLPYACSPEGLAAKCSNGTTAKVHWYVAHPNTSFDVANQDMADALGDVVFVCDETWAAVANGYDVATLYELEVDTHWGQYALCNGYPGVCFGGNQHAVGRESSFGAYGDDGGKCASNEGVGSWFSVPRAGECKADQKVGRDCSWRILRRVQTITLDCLIKARGLRKECAKEGGSPPFTKSVRIFEAAFASEDEAKGGCKDVCRELPACPRSKPSPTRGGDAATS